MWPDISPVICNRTYAGAACKHEALFIDEKLIEHHLGLILFSMNIAEGEQDLRSA